MTAQITLPEVHSGHVRAGALQKYCDTQGRGRPLLLLHAGLATIETSFEKSRPVLAKPWTTLAAKQQGHGHSGAVAAMPRLKSSQLHSIQNAQPN